MPYDNATMDDNVILARLKAGDKEVLTLLYNWYWEGLMRSCCKIVRDVGESEDIVQEVFLLIWEKRGELLIDKDIGSYLFGVLRFKMFNYLKTNRRKSEAFDRIAEVFESTPDAAFSPDRLLEYKELYLSVLDLVSSMPERCRVVYELRENDMSYQDIADVLDISVKTVENQLLKARKHLRTALRNFMWSVLLVAKATAGGLFIGHLSF